MDTLLGNVYITIIFFGFPPPWSEKIKFVYGGSVSPNNSEEILNSNIINGALVGGASLDVEQFVKIIESIELWI